MILYWGKSVRNFIKPYDERVNEIKLSYIHEKNMFTGRVHTNQYGDLEFAKCYYNFLKDKINAKKN